MIYETINVALRRQQEFELESFVVKSRDRVEWRFVPLLLPCCCDMPEGKDVLGVGFFVAVNRPCIRQMVSFKDIIGQRIDYGLVLRDIIMVTDRVSGTQRTTT